MIQIKIRFGARGEFRRARVDAPRTFVELTVKLEELFDVSTEFSPIYTIKYTDDEGDLVSIKTDAELEEAIRFCREEDAKALLRLTLFKGKAAPRKHAMNSLPEMISNVMGSFQSQAENLGDKAAEVPKFLQNAINQGLSSLESNPELRTKAAELLKSHGVVVETPFLCDGCDGPIEGDRYHCTECPDFDLCTQCKKNKPHEHKLRKIDVVDAVLETFKNGGGVDAFFRSRCPAKNRHMATCDVCEGAIVGIRHKCIDCADYDQCNLCFLSKQSDHPANHVFHSITDPKQRVIPEDVRNAHRSKSADNSNNDAPVKPVKRGEAIQFEFIEKAEKKVEKPVDEEFVVIKKEPEVVVIKKQVEKPKPKPVERTEPATAFEKNLETLEQMGFPDRKLNIKILVKNKNKLFPSIQQLLG